jgi:hypothetical protein
MDFGLGKMFAERAERGRQEHGIAEVFELQREDFFGLGAHEADLNCSS